MNKQRTKLVLMLVIGILIGLSAVSFMTPKSAIAPSTENTTAVQTGPLPSVADGTAQPTIGPANGLPAGPSIPKNVREGLNAKDQAAGYNVFISELVTTENKWIAVYDQRDGGPGNILGAARVHAGDTSIAVELLRATDPGQTYYVAILNDDGGETFNRQTDLPPLSPDRVVIVSFQAL